MDTVSSFEMFNELQKNKCITCFHKYIDIDNLISRDSGMSSEYFSLSTGITDNDFLRLKTDFEKLKNAGILVNFICIDVANGYMFKLIDFCKKVRCEFPNVTLIAGNVVSREIEELIINGQVDIVKVKGLSLFVLDYKQE